MLIFFFFFFFLRLYQFIQKCIQKAIYTYSDYDEPVI